MAGKSILVRCESDRGYVRRINLDHVIDILFGEHGITFYLVDGRTLTASLNGFDFDELKRKFN